MFIVSPELHSTLTSLLAFMSYSSSSNIYCALPHIFPHLLLLPAINSFLLLTLLFYTSLYILLLVHHDATQIISTLNTFSLGIYTFLLFNTKSSSICYSSSYNTFTSVFFIFSTILTTFLFLLLAVFIFS